LGKNAKRPENQGQSLVELALTLPLLVLLFAGLVEVVFFTRTYLVILEASREGARLGARGAAAYSNGQIETLVVDDLSREGYDSSALRDVIIVRADAGPGRQIDNYTVVSMRGSGRPARLTQAALLDRLVDADPYGPLIGVEIAFDHGLLLRFPILSDVIPDPIVLQPFSIMRVQR
jgi:hypothetical protein